MVFDAVHTRFIGDLRQGVLTAWNGFRLAMASTFRGQSEPVHYNGTHRVLISCLLFAPKMKPFSYFVPYISIVSAAVVTKVDVFSDLLIRDCCSLA